MCPSGPEREGGAGVGWEGGGGAGGGGDKVGRWGRRRKQPTEVERGKRGRTEGEKGRWRGKEGA